MDPESSCHVNDYQEFIKNYNLTISKTRTLSEKQLDSHRDSEQNIRINSTSKMYQIDRSESKDLKKKNTTLSNEIYDNYFKQLHSKEHSSTNIKKKKPLVNNVSITSKAEESNSEISDNLKSRLSSVADNSM